MGEREEKEGRRETKRVGEKGSVKKEREGDGTKVGGEADRKRKRKRERQADGKEGQSGEC